ncbi:DUF2029 domain-containing protein [Streptomyces sp. SID3343]|nr:DUF2029 domain-containing protein [Streptomyces sp. SID3343]
MDLHVYFGAVHAVRDGVPLYTYVAENGDPFTYPPFALLMFWPLGGLSEPAARVLWTLATLVAVVGIAAAMTARNGMVGRRRLVAVTLAGAGALIWSTPLQSNLRLGQVSVFLVLSALVDALGLTPRPLRGVLTGVAAAIKLTPLLFVPYLWITGRRRDAIRAGAAFAVCTGGTAVLWPAASVTFWTEAVFATSRIGNLAATGNQSLNGALIRSGIVPPERAVAWLILSALVCVIALVGARECHRGGGVAQGAVVVGCATVVASPVSWTHHQVWLVLAGLLLVGGPRKMRIAWGAALLVLMTFSVGGLLPNTFARDNVRLLAALAVCTWGLAPLRHRALATVPVIPGVRVLLRPRTALVYTGVLAVAAVGVLMAVHERPVEVRVQMATDQDQSFWGEDPNGCMGYSPLDGNPSSSGAWRCVSSVDADSRGRQLNFSSGMGGPQTQGWVVIQGQVGPHVARLVFVPVEGGRAVTVPLLPLSKPVGTPLYLPDTYRRNMHAPPDPSDPPVSTAPIPVVDGRLPSARSFSIAASSTDHSLLLAFGPDGQLVSDGGMKLRNG